MEEEEETEQTSSMTIGTPAKGGAFKFYFSLDEPLEKLIPIKAEDVEKAKGLTKIQKGLKVLAYLREQGFCRGE
ncbi:hypothetical protein M0R04_11295 [Candidatus Dojkabacteria bacterium]|jgi:hypothetical protein|nr:hypothetical protein [Candidatus Dojkabacteria bacterium]